MQNNDKEHHIKHTTNSDDGIPNSLVALAGVVGMLLDDQDVNVSVDVDIVCVVVVAVVVDASTDVDSATIKLSIIMIINHHGICIMSKLKQGKLKMQHY